MPRHSQTELSMPAYHTVTSTPHGRIGELRLSTNNRTLETPVLYPVINFLMGTSTRGGGVWKYILKILMQRQIPMLSQILHFLDFPLTGRYLENWRGKSMREHYREQNGVYDGTFFLDSGGFKLLYNTGMDLKEFGIHKETEADDILDLQLGFEGDIVASLDYPLPPNLARPEAEARMKQSLANAVQVAERLATNTSEMPTMPYLYTCCHGQSGEDISDYVSQLFAKMGGILPSFGLAVGSLVPLRGNEEFETEDAVVRYDFQLSPKNKAQIEQCATRLVNYLEKYGHNYVLAVGYATSRAYRKVLTLTEERFPGFILLPKELKQKRLAEFFRHTNLDTLVEAIQDKL